MKDTPTAVIAAIVLIGSLLAPAAPPYSGGDGSAANPYQIADVNDFLDLSATPTDWNKHFILTANIDLTDHPFTQAPIVSFTGVFDGGGHTISNLTIIAPTRDYVGLFGYIGQGGQVKNLGIVNTIIEGRNLVGGLAGWNLRNTTISNAYTTGSVSGTGGDRSGVNIGGLVGANSGSITYSFSTCSVQGNSDTGGLVGVNYNHIIACYAIGNVIGDFSVGGLAGGNRGIMASCYAAGVVNGDAEVGGFLGSGPVGGIFYYDCFWDIQTSGLTEGVGNPDTYLGVYGKTTAEMQTLSTFTDAGWDFTNTWAICEGTNYPRLRWQIPAADFACPDGVGMEDVAYLAARWLLNDCGQSDNCDAADLTGDGAVNLADFAILADLWLK